jgi:hypothetical protein
MKKLLMMAVALLALTATTQAGNDANELIPKQFHGAWCESVAATMEKAAEYRRGKCHNGITVTASGYSGRTHGRCKIRWTERNGSALQVEFACTLSGDPKKEIAALCFLEARDSRHAALTGSTQCLEE